MRSKLMSGFLLLISLFLLSGCQTSILVHDASVAMITPIFKDYAGSHGYVFTYQNDKTGTYGLDLGSVYQPYTSSTSRSSSFTSVPASSGQPLTAYEETTWNTVAYGGRYVEALATVRILQQGSDVQVLIDTNDAGGTTLNDFLGYIRAYGYTVENK